MSTMAVVVTHAGTAHTVQLQAGDTFATLKQRISAATGVAPERQRLLHKQLSRRRQDSGAVSGKDSDMDMDIDSVVVSTVLPDGARVIMLGSKELEIAAVQQLDQQVATQRARDLKRQQAQHKADAKRHPAAAPPSITDTFEVLPQHSDPHKSLAMLKKLAADAGVHALVIQRGWTVHRLIELCPVQDSSLLGYNRNRGEVIALRLRTDNLLGWRAYSSVRRVLIHELTHMQHSDHDDAFWALYRQLERDSQRLDWRSGGSALDGSGSRTSSSGNYASISVDEQEQQHQRLPFEGGSGRLGGLQREVATLPQSRQEMRDRAAAAATRRLTEQEQQEQDGCGSSH